MNYRARMIGGSLQIQPGRDWGNGSDLPVPGARTGNNEFYVMMTQIEWRADEKSRILLVDDHPIVRQGLALLINHEPDLAFAAKPKKPLGAMHVHHHSPARTFLIVDISLNGPDGIDLLKNIRNRYPSLPVLILSMHDESIYAERALRAGANGYIMKQEATEKVLVAIRTHSERRNLS